MVTPMNGRLALEQLRRWMSQGVVPLKYRPLGRKSVIIRLSDGREETFIFPDGSELDVAVDFIRILIEDHAEYDRQTSTGG